MFEAVVHGIFLLLGLITVGCVLLITVYHIISGILQGIQRRLSCGFQSIIMAVACPFEFAALFAHIGSCDNTANSPLIPHSQFSGNLTVMIQGLKSHGFLIAADLKHRIR